MSLSIQAIDRLFTRLGATYGRNFLGQYEGQDAMAVKTSWAHELSGYAKNMMPIAWALENLPDKVLNVLEFRSLCRRAPAAEVPRLPEPAADPARLAAELSKLGQLRESVAAQPGANTNKDWARAIIAKHEAGIKVNITPLLFARQALGLAK